MDQVPSLGDNSDYKDPPEAFLISFYHLHWYYPDDNTVAIGVRLNGILLTTFTALGCKSPARFQKIPSFTESISTLSYYLYHGSNKRPVIQDVRACRNKQTVPSPELSFLQEIKCPQVIIWRSCSVSEPGVQRKLKALPDSCLLLKPRMLEQIILVWKEISLFS